MLQRSLLSINIVLLVILGVLIFDQRFNRFEEAKAQRDYSSEYKYTNPILDFENTRMEESFINIDKTKDKVEKIRERYGLSFSSVYFRDLDNGQWIGINEKEQFASASLIKLPILIAFLHQSELEQGLLEKVVTITRDDAENDVIQDFPPKNPLKVGQSYTLLEVAKKMMQESDNIAMKVLVKNIDDKYRNSVFKAVGVEFNVDGEDIMVRVKDYAGFFRVLFNASYLTRENSELALEILANTDFDRGVVAGVPRTLTVSHKFGERAYYADSVPVSKQLHDCGIVYYPQKPYILCVMTRGNNFDDQAAFIREVSKLFYQELEKNL